MAQPSPRSHESSTANPDEIARFTAIADAWWDPQGDFKPLHRLNPPRLAFIRDRAVAHFGLDGPAEAPLAGLSVLDIGCGGGLLSEPLARMGATVTGLDAGARNVAVAALHAEQSGVAVAYRHGVPEDLAAEGLSFDLVLNMEIVEHVADLGAFLAASASLVRPGGLMVLSTLNRTLKSLALAKIGAEYILRWLPRGMHDWRKFVKPSELAAGLGRAGLDITELTGVAYNPLADQWRLAPRDLDVNYMALATRADA
ncbi:MAG: bifunctional 2-polyprenyl-6-hydroxyphenol methylase/3-demethylubiquinol 3-O-methyltransferase UbiG [Rhodobacterales bacterium]|nr:bifunctional 2-polyprenyl-6-hydroxyphenol methylase/3-demethylubiquinol 3-O-methyltransferase UbiG [Rhodobacterales bacterium]